MGGFQNAEIGSSQTQLRQMRQELIRWGMQVIEKMERETGLEPATSSLGISASIENKSRRRPLRRNQIYAVSATSSHTVLRRPLME